MATLEQARARFARALDRVEAAARRAPADDAGRARLEADLAQLRRENDALRSAARAASERLDGAIARVRALAGE